MGTTYRVYATQKVWAAACSCTEAQLKAWTKAFIDWLCTNVGEELMKEAPTVYSSWEGTMKYFKWEVERGNGSPFVDGGNTAKRNPVRESGPRMIENRGNFKMIGRTGYEGLLPYLKGR